MRTPTSILFKEIKKGNRAAFDTLFSLMYPSLIVHACRFVRNEDAENTVQDVMLYLWENRSRMEVQDIERYLFSAVRNKCITLINQGVVRRKVESELERRLSEGSTSDAILLMEVTSRMEQALSQMPEEYRDAFEMNRFYGKSYKEIADIKNVSPKTVDYRIQQALKSLRLILKDYNK